MTMPVEIERKVRQLDNDVQSIYEMLAEIAATQRRQGNRLMEIASNLTEMDGTLTRTAGKVTEMDGTLTRTASNLTEMDGKLDTILGLLRGGQPG
jgi:methyl-accepting chemotaxis protein